MFKILVGTIEFPYVPSKGNYINPLSFCYQKFNETKLQPEDARGSLQQNPVNLVNVWAKLSWDQAPNPINSDGHAWQTRIETLTQVVSEKIVNGPTKVVNHNILTVVVG